MRKNICRFCLILLIVTNPVKADNPDNIVNTKEYFPIDTQHSYMEAQGDNKWHTTFLGLKTIDNQQVYTTATFISTGNHEEKLADQSLYIIDHNGDILKVGTSYNSWLTKWCSEPEIYLMGKMKIGTIYTLLDDIVNGNTIKTYLTLKRRLNLRLVNRTVECILVDKTVVIEEFSGIESKLDTYTEWRYFAKGIGLVKHSGNCYQCQCGTQVPTEGKITLTEIENN